MAISAILLCVLYLGYRIYESKSDAALLREKTLEDAVPTVAVVYPKPVAPTETITLPGNIQAWFRGADLRAGLGLCEDVVQGLRRAGEEGRHPRRNQRAGPRRPICAGQGGSGRRSAPSMLSPT